VPEEVQIMDSVYVPVKRKKLFEDGTDIIAKVVGAQWVQGKFSPGVAVDLKTVTPAVGYSLRTTCYLSTRKDDGSHFVMPDKDLDKLQSAVLSDEEFFLMDAVSPETWVGRPVAFQVEVIEKEIDGESRRINIIREGSFRRPTDEELASIQESLKGSQAAKALSAPTTTNGSEEVSEEIEEGDFSNLPLD
jgi:hypothetical protein